MRLTNKLIDMPSARKSFCACAFMNKIYFFGGRKFGSGYLNYRKKQNGKKLEK